MALALEPAVLILDEPTSALDVSIQAQIMNLLKRLRSERGTSMLFITHDLALASDLCDSLGVLYAGQLREIGGADEVLTAPNDPYTRALLSSIPRLHGGTRPYLPARRPARPPYPVARLSLPTALPGGVRAVPRACARPGRGGHRPAGPLLAVPAAARKGGACEWRVGERLRRRVSAFHAARPRGGA